MIAQSDRLCLRTRSAKAVSRLLNYAVFEGRSLTTKGQCINPLVFAHFALEMRVPLLKEVKEPVFIPGMGRSGSTLLGRLLSLHQEVGVLNEAKVLGHAVYLHEVVIGNCCRGTVQYCLAAEDATEEVSRRMNRLLGACLSTVASERIVDNYPTSVYRVPFVHAIVSDARFIFPSRNGWDTCSVVETWSQRKSVHINAGRHDWWGVNNREWRLSAALPDALTERQ